MEDYIEAKVKLVNNKVPVRIEILAGYVVLGTYTLSYAAKANPTKSENFGKGNLDDNEKDIFQIPILPDSLENYVVYVLGKYSPAPGHSQISITYKFRQGEIILSVIPIEPIDKESPNIIQENVEEGKSIWPNHIFYFENN